MTPENIEDLLTAQGFLCPSCGNKGKAVKQITIESLLTDEAKARVSSRDGFQFCPTPTCEVSYFHPETGKRFLCRDVRVRIGQKQTQAPRAICYCFNHTIEEIETEVAKTGTSKIPDAITEKCRQGLGRCEQTNPQGSCCIADVRRAVKEAQVRFGKEKRIQTEAYGDSKALADGLAEALKVDIEVQRACVELYRQLATGKPVPLENVASVLAVSVGDLKETLAKWAISALEYDKEGRVVAFGGLTLKPTAHRFQLSGQPLYTWCAFDTLFIPRLLNKSAQVTSTCPVSGRPIRLSVAPGGIEQCRPDGVYISLLAYPARQLEGNVKSCFCCHVHFFASQDAARTWLSEHEEASVLPVNEASKLAQSVMERVFQLPAQVPNSGEESAAPAPDCCPGEAPSREWERSDAKSPDYVKQYGSPTILVDGKDVGGALPGDGKSCRVYTDSDGSFRSVPSPEAIASALSKAKEDAACRGGRPASHTRRYRRILAVFPAIGAVLIPGLSCPLCWPAYAGLLSSLGLGFVNYTPYLFPLTLLCLAVAVLSLGFSARRRRGYGPLVLGFVGGVIILTGKFILTWQAVTSVGVVALVSACIWNLWPRKTISDGSCSDCVPAGASRTRPERRPALKGD